MSTKEIEAARPTAGQIPQELGTGLRAVPGCSEQGEGSEGRTEALEGSDSAPGEAPEAAERAPEVENEPSTGGVEHPKDGPEAHEQARKRGKTLLSRAMEDFRPFHSEFQIDRFIVPANGFTDWAAYVQTCREIATRVESMKLDYLAAGRLQVDRDEAVIEAEEAEVAYHEALKRGTKTFAAVKDDEDRANRVARSTHSFHARKRRAELTRTECILKIDSLRRTIVDKERELGRFIAHFEMLLARLEANGPLTTERKQALEAESWKEKARYQSVTETLGNGGLSSETLALVCSLDISDRDEVLTFTQSEREELQKWVLNRQRPSTPTGTIPSAQDVRGFVC